MWRWGHGSNLMVPGVPWGFPRLRSGRLNCCGFRIPISWDLDIYRNGRAVDRQWLGHDPKCCPGFGLGAGGRADTIAAVNSAPLGIFDSGVGGLTVVRAVQELLPAENI